MMLRKSFLSVISFAFFSLILAGYNTSEAAVTLPWATTFNCDAWNQSLGLGIAETNCDGLQGWGAWTCDTGEGSATPGVIEEQITANANNPNNTSATMTKGQRHWKGDGSNFNSGGLSLWFVQAQPELWVRWYMRYQKGFKWNPLQYDKILYFWTGTYGAEVIAEWWNGDSFNFYAQGDGGGNYSCLTNCGWNSTMGGSTSDGQWHYFEVHLKEDTNGSNGIMESWIDGKKGVSVQNAYMGTRPGWTHILIGSNQRYPNNGACLYVDFDDIAVSSTGYIGPLPDTLHPSGVSGVQAN